MTDGFDRVVSVEMFEHVRNHELLLARIHGWLRPCGKLFVHHFSNVDVAYPFETGGSADWMARHFFTGGLMPSDDWLLHVPTELRPDDHWIIDGSHYARTCEAWIERMDAHRGRILGLFADAYGRGRAEAWFHRWRVFNLACAELFAYDDGARWVVTHLRFARAA